MSIVLASGRSAAYCRSSRDGVGIENYRMRSNIDHCPFHEEAAGGGGGEAAGKRRQPTGAEGTCWLRPPPRDRCSCRQDRIY